MSTASNRIIQLDFFRGLMLIVMMLNHVRYFPLWTVAAENPEFARFTFQPLGFFTAAEGFVFLSGLVFALVYTPRFIADGKAAFDRHVARRFGFIYGWHMGTYALIAVLFLIPAFNAAWPPHWESQELIKNAPFAMLMRASVLMHQTGLLDILPMYLCFIVFIPIVMRGLAAGRSGLVLAIIAIIWALAQFRPQTFIEAQYGIHLGWFEVLAWQLIFFGGFVLGYHLRTGLKIPLSTKWLTIAGITCVTLFIYRQQIPGQFASVPESIAALVNDRGLGAVRLLNMAAFTYLLYALCLAKPNWCKARAFTILGENSIQVFSFHILVCYAAMPFRPWLAEQSVGLALAFGLVLTLSIYLPALLLQKKSRA